MINFSAYKAGLTKKFIFYYKSNVKRTFTWKIDYSFDTHDFLKKISEYETKLDDMKKNLNLLELDNTITGSATENGTLQYTNRNKSEIHAENFKSLEFTNWKVSTLGLGTYIGPPDDLNDFYIYNAVKSSVLSGGINLIDSAINYRYMKSERAVGKALKTLLYKYEYDRGELIISSKIGYVPEDADNGKRCHSFVQHLVENNKISIEDIIFDDKKRPVHCMHPEFLREQLNLSLNNLGLETIDIMYLHNAVESQGAILPAEQFEERLTKAFEFLESARNEGKIKIYGLATWNSFRCNSSSQGLHANLQSIFKIAEKVGGVNHGFRVIMVPVNIMHPEAFVEKYQNFVTEKDISVPVTLTAACSSLGINLISCSPLMQGYLVNLPLENVVFNVKHNSSKHLQLIRSIPADSLKSTLVGMKSTANIKTNIEIISKPRLTSQQFYNILAPKKRLPFVEKDIEAGSRQ